MTTTGLVAWAFVFYVAYQIKQGLATERGQRLLDAVVERLKAKKEG